MSGTEPSSLINVEVTRYGRGDKRTVFLARPGSWWRRLFLPIIMVNPHMTEGQCCALDKMSWPCMVPLAPNSTVFCKGHMRKLRRIGVPA